MTERPYHLLPPTEGFRIAGSDLWAGRAIPCTENVAVWTVYAPRRTKIISRREWETWHPTGLDGDVKAEPRE